MPEEKNEHRRFPRIPAAHAILVKRLGHPDEEVFAKTRVVGLGGCSFVYEEPLGRGTVVELLISMRNEVVRATARVVNELRLGDAAYEECMEFLFISDAHRKVLETLLSRGKRTRPPQ